MANTSSSVYLSASSSSAKVVDAHVMQLAATENHDHYDKKNMLLLRILSPLMLVHLLQMLNLVWQMVYWIRVHEFPLAKMAMKVAQWIGECSGTLVVVDGQRISDNLGDFFRLKVELLVTKPLL
ncbi:hypothetical protein V6N13_073228 [Hibiscus sabdariffa]